VANFQTINKMANNNNTPITHISKVEVKGFWNKYDFSWDLNPDVNILAGANGSGKSTILDFVAGLLLNGNLHKKQQGRANKINVIFNNDKFIEYFHLKINDSIKNLEKKAKSDKYTKIAISQIKEQEGSNYSKIKALVFEAGISNLENLGMGIQEMQSVINIEVISTFDTPLSSFNFVKSTSAEIHTTLDVQLYELQKRYLDYKLTIGKRKDAVIESETSENIKEKVAKIQAPHLRFLDMIDIFFRETDKKVNRDENEMVFLLDNDTTIKTNQLSSGEKQALIILLTTLLQDHKQSIFFLDEPEISLHIEWQKKLIDFIRELNPNAQIIVATHSPAMIMNGWGEHVFNMFDLLTKTP